MANNLSLNIEKEQMLNELKNSLKVFNDIYFENGFNTKIMKNGYNPNKSYEENKKSCIQYLAIKKAYKK